MCKCPAHDDSTPSLSIRVGERNLLFKCFAGCHVTDVLRAIAQYDVEAPIAASGSIAVRQPNEMWLRHRVRDLWDEARPIVGSPAQAYLSSRGIAHMVPALRYHPRTPLKTSLGLITRPAMLAAVVERERVVALQRGFLDLDRGGLATDLGKPRRMLGRPGRGAVVLAEPADVLGIAEGVETALSAMFLLGIPIWATLGAERIDKVEIPLSVKKLLLLPDNDEAGRIAAVAARHAYAAQGRVIGALFPPKGVKDWNELIDRRNVGPHPARAKRFRLEAWLSHKVDLGFWSDSRAGGR
jgi:hypothetical protein